MANNNRSGMSVQEAGRKGGQATARDHDMSEIGRKGGETTKKKYGADFYEEIGKKGGEAQGKQNNPGNFANDRQKAREAGRKGGER